MSHAASKLKDIPNGDVLAGNCNEHENLILDENASIFQRGTSSDQGTVRSFYYSGGVPQLGVSGNKYKLYGDQADRLASRASLLRNEHTKSCLL